MIVSYKYGYQKLVAFYRETKKKQILRLYFEFTLTHATNRFLTV